MMELFDKISSQSAMNSAANFINFNRLQCRRTCILGMAKGARLRTVKAGNLLRLSWAGYDSPELN